MKNIYKSVLIFAFFLVLGAKNTNAQSINISNLYTSPGCVTLPPGTTCFDENTTFCITYSEYLVVHSGLTEYFVAELSDYNGSFATPTEIGRVAYSTSLLPITATLIGNISTSSNFYRIRVVLVRAGSTVSGITYYDNGWDINLYRFNFPSSFLKKMVFHTFMVVKLLLPIVA